MEPGKCPTPGSVADADGQKEAIFGHRTVMTLDKTVHTADENFELPAVHDIDSDGFEELIGRGVQNSTIQVWGAGNTTGISAQDMLIAGFQLQQNYPNPFNPETAISYQLSTASNARLVIYNTLGQQRVRILVDTPQSAGVYEVHWDGRNDSGQQVASGTYLYHLISGEHVTSKHMLLLK